MKLTISKVERYTLNLHFSYERQRYNMHRALTHGERVILWKLETDARIVGWGDADTGQAQPSPEEVASMVGRNLFEYLNGDSLDDGLQQAVLDAAGKALEVPVHKLLGRRGQPGD